MSFLAFHKYYIIDNSGYKPTVITIPAFSSKTKLKIGSTKIKLSATDLAGNTAKCTFNVEVVGKLRG